MTQNKNEQSQDQGADRAIALGKGLDVGTANLAAAVQNEDGGITVTVERNAFLDIPIVLPPLVIGLSLLILFQFPPFSWVAPSVVYQVPAVVFAQFSVACAFSVRTMKATFDQIDPRCEQVARTLGCSRFQAFSQVVFPEADRGMITALTLAWARSLGEFGPLLIFAGSTRMKTEVLSTSVFLEMNVGNLEAAVAVSLIMVAGAVVILIVTRWLGGIPDERMVTERRSERPIDALGDEA